MDPFYAAKDRNGSFYIECRLIVYRHKLGKHPDFLQKYEGNAADGYNTKFFLEIEKGIVSAHIANKRAAELNEQYKDLINNCESTGNWDAFPFKNCEILYYK